MCTIWFWLKSYLLIKYSLYPLDSPFLEKINKILCFFIGLIFSWKLKKSKYSIGFLSGLGKQLDQIGCLSILR